MKYTAEKIEQVKKAYREMVEFRDECNKKIAEMSGDVEFFYSQTVEKLNGVISDVVDSLLDFNVDIDFDADTVDVSIVREGKFSISESFYLIPFLDLPELMKKSKIKIIEELEKFKVYEKTKPIR